MSDIFTYIFKYIFKAPVWFYSKAISPLLGPRCRFHPTCSAYACEALDRHGPWRGIMLALRRFCSCHPWSGRSGYDPVPPKEGDEQQDR